MTEKTFTESEIRAATTNVSPNNREAFLKSLGIADEFLDGDDIRYYLVKIEPSRKNSRKVDSPEILLRHIVNTGTVPDRQQWTNDHRISAARVSLSDIRIVPEFYASKIVRGK